jgi:hypothetical protein
LQSNVFIVIIQIFILNERTCIEDRIDHTCLNEKLKRISWVAGLSIGI